MRAVLTVLAVALFVYFIYGSHRPAPPPGPAAPHEPVQFPADERTWHRKDYTITSLARYHIEALVVSTERYWIDNGADLSPIDFAVAWGPLSDAAIVDQLSFSQGHRWFWFHGRRGPMPLPEEVVNSHCANMHMIPADGAIEKQLKSVAPSDVVDMSGYLVEVTGPKKFKWRSSLSRTDTGNGACELMWVEEITKRL
jgi:hypothetical protein